MTEGKIAQLTVEGYLSMRSAPVRLGDLTVLVGANGSGKSNFISALELLGRIVDEDLGLYVGRRGGAADLMYRGAGQDRRIVLDVTFNPNGYRAVLVPGTRDELIFEDERVRFHDASKYDQPGDWSIGHGHSETGLHRAVSERGSAVAGYVRDMLSGCRVFHFHDTSITAPVKRQADSANNLRLMADAENLAPFLRGLRDRVPVHYERVRSTVQLVAPFFRDFVLEEEFPGRMRLRWQHVNIDGDFGAGALSDGTLRFVCLTALLLQPSPPQLIVLDEPELGLHPFAIVTLAGMLRSASRRCQVVVATQSVTLMSQFEIDDLLVVDRVAGESTFTRHDAAQFANWLADYSLGELWEKNLLGGRPAREVAG